MSFLAPLFLAGIALIAGPILFHLMRQSPRNRVVFSSTELLEPTPPKAKRRSRIQNRWLLLLRCLVIALLAFAFSRPFLTGSSSAPAAADMQRDVVIAIDESASMSREELQAARSATINATIDDLDPLDRVSIIAFSDTAVPVVAADQWRSWPPDQRKALAKAAVEQRQPNHLPGKLDLAIEAALEELEVLRESQDRQGIGEILLLSDFGSGSSLSGLAGIEWPTNAALRRVPIAPPNRNPLPNLSLKWLGWSESGDAATARLALATDRPELPIQATIGAQDPESGETFATSGPLQVEGKEQSLVTVELPSTAPTSPISFVIDSADAATYDNTLPVAPNFVPQVAVQYHGLSEQNNPKAAAYFVQRAFSGFDAPKVQLMNGSESASSAPDAVVIDAPLTSDAIRRVAQQARAGADVLFIASNSEQAAELNQLTNAAGWRIQSSESGNALYGNIAFNHPLFSQFADPRYSDFTSIRAWNPLDVSVPPDSDPEVLVRFDSGAPAVLELSLGQGRLILWAHSWSPSETNWPLSTKFVPWLHRFASRSIGGTPNPSNVELRTASLNSYSAFTDWQPIDGEEAIGQPQEAGLYQASSPQGTRWIAWQLPPEEGSLVPIDHDTWDALGLPEYSAAQQRQRAAQVAAYQETRNAVETERNQKLWRWLLFSALVLLFFESVVAIATANRRERAAA